MPPGATLGSFALELVQAFEAPADAIFDEESLRHVLSGFQGVAGLDSGELAGSFEELPAPPPPPPPLPPSSPPSPAMPPLAPPANTTNSSTTSMRRLSGAPPIDGVSSNGVRQVRLMRRLAIDAGLDMQACNSTLLTKKTIVTVKIATMNPAAYEALIALSQGSPSARYALASSPVMNRDGQAFSLCTKSVVSGQTRNIEEAPSPPPPAPPPVNPPEPPAPPPFNLLPGGLDVFAFVNVSNPAAAALTQLLQASAGTVQAAATVAVGASVAASAAASAVGGAAGGGGGPSALMGAQRNALYGMVGGAPQSCDAPGAAGNGGGWTMGRLGVGGDNPCADGGGRLQTGRRLQKGGGGKSGGADGGKGDGADGYEEEEDLTQRLLVQAMVDTILSVSMIFGVIVILHVLVLLLWKCCVNRRFYRWARPSNIRVVYIVKKPGARLGVGLQGNVIMHVEPGSSCAGLLLPGDKVHVVNGIQLKPARMWIRWACAQLDIRVWVRWACSVDLVGAKAAKLISGSSKLYMLVSSPPETSRPLRPRFCCRLSCFRPSEKRVAPTAPEGEPPSDPNAARAGDTKPGLDSAVLSTVTTTATSDADDGVPQAPSVGPSDIEREQLKKAFGDFDLDGTAQWLQT